MMCGRLPREIRRAWRRAGNFGRRLCLAYVAVPSAVADLLVDFMVDTLNVDVDRAMTVIQCIAVCVGALWLVVACGVMREVELAAPMFLPAAEPRTVVLGYSWWELLRATEFCLRTLLTVGCMLLHKVLSCCLVFWIRWPMLASVHILSLGLGVWLSGDD